MFQFGYDMFNSEYTDLPVGAISEDYVLGIGDALTVVFTGQEAAAYALYERCNAQYLE